MKKNDREIVLEGIFVHRFFFSDEKNKARTKACQDAHVMLPYVGDNDQ